MFMKLKVSVYKLVSQILASSSSIKREQQIRIFFEWMNEFALIPFINEMKTFITQSTQNLLESNNVVCGKPPGQTTKITQACDDSDLFRGPKGKLPYITDESVSNNTEIINSIDAVFKKHDEYLRNDSITLKFDGNHKKKAIIGLLRIQQAIKVSVNSETITKGFSNTGIYDYSTKSYSLNKMINNFNVPMDDDLVLKVIKAVPVLARKVKDQGELFDIDFNKVGLPVTKNKDHRVLTQRRMVILGHSKVIERELAKSEQKNLKESSKNEKVRKRKLCEKDEDVFDSNRAPSTRIKKAKLMESFVYDEDEDYEE